MEEQIVITVAERFPWASWAVWDNSFPEGGCIEEQPKQLIDFVCEHTTHLTADVVLLGLNRSNHLTSPFQNFHAPTRRHYDYRLKEFIQDDGLDRLWGAYMTDLVDDVNPESNEVRVTDTDAEILLNQLHLLGESEYDVICFGNKPFDGLTRYFDGDVSRQSPEIKRATVNVDGLTLRLYRVWFYGLYGANQDKVDTLKRQFQHLNERIE